MALPESPTYPTNEIEALIAALTGVLAARVSLDYAGGIEEVHVLADEQLHPKQIVRNIESALGAGLGLTLDRRIISVAQVRGDADAVLENDEETPILEEPAPEPAPRYIFVGHDARSQPNVEATCRVTIRQGAETISGTGTGLSTPLGRAQAAARAVFAAIAAARHDNVLGLEGVTLVESNGREHVLVAAHALAGREPVSLTGVAAVVRSPEEAAILASLQATNRWASFDG